MGKIVKRLLLCLFLTSFTAIVNAAPLLRCYVTYAGQTQIVQSRVQSNPYLIPAIDVQSRFRFKAVMAGNAEQAEYIKLYVYYQAAAGDVLIHQASYQAPFALSENEIIFTARNHLYAGILERELEYYCSLQEA